MQAVHTPYDGSSRPFTIGLQPLDLQHWTEADDTLDTQLREKRRLFATIADKVFVEEAETRTAQREVFDLLRRHVLDRHPALYNETGDGIAIGGSVGLNREEGETLPPLHAAALLVQEDLILMRRSDDGWRLAAGALCFPSSWSLGEKFGRPLEDIHGPVPGFGRGTRTADIINRMFDNLKAEQPVQRMNWSLQARHELYYPLSDTQRIERASGRPSKFADLAAVARGYIRVERQTLRRLPVSGDILFTIRIYLDPLRLFETHPDRRRLADSFTDQLCKMTESQLDYKGLTADRERLIQALQRFSGAARS